MKAYEILFIDADETLFDFRKAEEYAFAQSFSRAGIEAGPEAYRAYDEINKELWRRLERGEIDQKRLRVERFRLLFAALGLELDERAFSDDYVRWLSKASFLLDGAEGLCASLSASRRLFILTNGIAEVQHSRLELSPIRKYIEDIFISEEAGSAKPDRAFFEYACERADLRDKARILMIGDSLSSDIKGALDFGIDSCWVNLAGARNESGLKPTYEVRSLAEIAKLA